MENSKKKTIEPRFCKDQQALAKKISGTALSIKANSAVKGEQATKFHAKQGHGYAAEQANNLVDVIRGKSATVVGDNNAKNGADRIVDGISIQTKYCANAKATINAAFDSNGEFRYFDQKGNPMQVEVPKEQYSDAVALMEKKISKGRIRGVTDPKKAKELVRKGNVTYKQAMNIAKAGRIESIIYDSINGAVIATNAFGISASIVLAKELWSGENTREAIDKAIYSGIQAGSVAFITSVVSAQIARTSISQALMAPSIAIVKALPPTVRHYLVNSLKNGANIYGAAASNNLAKLLRGNVISGTIIVLVVSAPQVIEMFRGRISGKELFKTVTSAASGLGGGTIGAMIGSSLGPVGTVLGGIIGGVIAGSGVSALLNKFIESDAIQMVRILESRLPIIIEEYLLTEEEANLVIEKLKVYLEGGFLLAMFASKDRDAFADEMLISITEELLSWRTNVTIPQYEEFINRTEDILNGIEQGRDMSYLVNSKQFDTVKFGEKLLGKRLDKGVTDKAMYVTKQFNLVEEGKIAKANNSLNNEKAYRNKNTQDKQDIEELRQFFLSIMECREAES